MMLEKKFIKIKKISIKTRNFFSDIYYRYWKNLSLESKIKKSKLILTTTMVLIIIPIAFLIPVEVITLLPLENKYSIKPLISSGVAILFSIFGIVLLIIGIYFYYVVIKLNKKIEERNRKNYERK